MRIGGIVNVVAATLSVWALVTRARAQVDCSDPDNLCTGNPCVVPSLAVASPCVADFRPRTLVLAGTVQVPGGGVVSLTAASVSTTGSLTSDRALGASITLSATDDILLPGSIDLLNMPENGFAPTLRLSAGGDVDVSGSIHVPSPSTGGAHADVTIDAGGTISVSGRVKADGGVVTVHATRSVTVSAPMSVARFGGDDTGGILELSSAADDVTIAGVVRVQGRGTGSGIVRGGTLRVSAQADVVMSGAIKGRGRDRGADVRITSAAGDVRLDSRIVATPTGTVVVRAGRIATLTGRLVVGGESPLGFGFGCVRVDAPSIVVGSDATIKNEAGSSAGVSCFTGTGGDVRLGGTFLSRAPRFQGAAGTQPGIIQASAGGDLVADGVFRCAPSGCIGLMAGGTLDTAGGSFDKSPSADCGIVCDQVCP